MTDNNKKREAKRKSETICIYDLSQTRAKEVPNFEVRLFDFVMPNYLAFVCQFLGLIGILVTFRFRICNMQSV